MHAFLHSSVTLAKSTSYGTIRTAKEFFKAGAFKGHSLPSYLPIISKANLNEFSKQIPRATDDELHTTEKLVIYSKPGCCLCDGLKEKIQAVLLLDDIGCLKNLELEVRDITSNPDWYQAFQYEIPVMTRVRSNGDEIPISRQSPRVTIERLKLHLQKAFT